jgi:hypothetical protein
LHSGVNIPSADTANAIRHASVNVTSFASHGHKIRIADRSSVVHSNHVKRITVLYLHENMEKQVRANVDRSPPFQVLQH